jgi:hypothetical protein
MLQQSGFPARRRILHHARPLFCGAALVAFSGVPSFALLPSPTPQMNSLPPVIEAGVQQPPVVLAQAQGKPATFRVSDLSGPASQPLPLNIDLLDAEKDSGQLFIFSGLPRGVTLKPGGYFGDFWAVNANVIHQVKLTAPPGFSGSFTIWITRGRGEATDAQPVSLTVTIGGPATTPTAAAATTAIPDSTPKPRSAVPNEAMLVARAKASFDKGDVSGARAIYEYLALQGSSAAAMAMGETFDPLVLAKLVVKGLEADEAKARFWYEKAETLGSREARSRLNALAAR